MIDLLTITVAALITAAWLGAAIGLGILVAELIIAVFGLYENSDDWGDGSI